MSQSMLRWIEMFKNMRLVILYQVSPIELEPQLAQVNLYTRKDFKSLGNGSLYEK